MYIYIHQEMPTVIAQTVDRQIVYAVFRLQSVTTYSSSWIVSLSDFEQCQTNNCVTASDFEQCQTNKSVCHSVRLRAVSDKHVVRLQ